MGELQSEGSVAPQPDASDEEWLLAQTWIDGFQRTLAGIRQIVTLVEPHLETKGSGPPPELEALLTQMTLGQRGAVGMFLAEAAKRHRPDTEDHRQDEAVDQDTVADTGTSTAASDQVVTLGNAATNGDEHPPEPSPDAHEQQLWRERIMDVHEGRINDEEVRAYVEEEFKNAPWLFAEFARRFQGVLIDPDRMMLLNRSLLITAVAAFETLLGRLLGLQHAKFPGLLEREVKQFSLEDLQAFDTIADARAAAIQQRVDSLMRESFEGWERWFDRTAKVDLGSLCVDIGRLKEVMQRRHVVVHNDGRVSPQYLAKLNLKEPPVGKALPVESNYLERALDELLVLGVSLGTQVAASWLPKHAAATTHELHLVAYALLESGRYDACQRLCEIGLDRAGRGWTIEAMRVNAWLARKFRDGVDSVSSEVRPWDVSALSPEFGLAKAALLDDVDAVFEMLPGLIEAEHVSRKALEDWPLFAHVRTDARFPTALELFDPTPSPDQSS